MMQSMKTILEHTSLRALGAFVTDTSVPLEELLREHQPAPAMVMVEHDAWFLRRVAERTCPVGEG